MYTRLMSASSMCTAFEYLKEWHPIPSGISSGCLTSAMAAYFLIMFRTAIRYSFSPCLLGNVGCLRFWLSSNLFSYMYLFKLFIWISDRGTILAILPLPTNRIEVTVSKRRFSGVASMSSYTLAALSYSRPSRAKSLLPFLVPRSGCCKTSLVPSTVRYAIFGPADAGNGCTELLQKSFLD